MQGNGPTLSKQQYLQSMLSTFQKFEYTRSPQVLRNYMKKTRQALSYQIDELARYQSAQEDRVSEQSQAYSPTYLKEKELNQRLEKEYAEELEISKGNNIRQSQIRFNDKCQEMDSSLFSLNKQLDKLVEDNKNMMSKLEKQRFYREWQVMYKEFQGAKSLNSRLKAQLEKKKLEIQKITNK